MRQHYQVIQLASLQKNYSSLFSMQSSASAAICS